MQDKVVLEDQDLKSVKRLTPEEYEKWLKFGKRGYEYCATTLERLYDYKYCVYDKDLDLFFKDHRARIDYLQFKKTKTAKKKTFFNKKFAGRKKD